MRSELHGRLIGWVRYRRLLGRRVCPLPLASAYSSSRACCRPDATCHGDSVDSKTSLTLCALSNWASSSWRPAYSTVQSRFCAEIWWPLDSPYRGHRRRMLITFIAPRVLPHKFGVCSHERCHNLLREYSTVSHGQGLNMTLVCSM
jgi:hypothetical protein